MCEQSVNAVDNILQHILQDPTKVPTKTPTKVTNKACANCVSVMFSNSVCTMPYLNTLVSHEVTFVRTDEDPI